MRLLLLGRGKMGAHVEALAGSYGFELVDVLATPEDAERLTGWTGGSVDVAIDFTAPDAVPRNLPRLIALGFNVVVGTTGWAAQEAAFREQAARAGVGVLVAANFSLGMHVFQLVVEEAARRFANHVEFGAFVHERHHDQKKDAPSGTALMLQRTMVEAGYARAIDMSSARAGYIPGTHTVGFDGPSETITLEHSVRDRAVFARGALHAARWLVGRRGWFSMRDVVMGTELGAQLGTGSVTGG